MQFASDHILLIGDRDHHVGDALNAALPGTPVTCVDSLFDGLAELHAAPFSTVVAGVEAMERRPEPAVRAIRQSVGARARLLLYGNTTLEPLSRKMLEFGVDDYFVTPADAGELRQLFATPRAEPTSAREFVPDARERMSLADALPVGELSALALDMLLEQPQASVAQLARRLAGRMPAGVSLRLSPRPQLDEPTLARPIANVAGVIGHLHLGGEATLDDPRAAAVLADVAELLTKVALLEERHTLMQRLAITDDLTGLYNARYFNHFLARILEKAKARRFAVTLLLFDIDNFKRYNDQFGHGVGDEILKQTAGLMRKCCRDHDLVARIGGDEFAVVFWEKDAPRVPRDPAHAAHGRVPSTPMIIAQRFRKQLGSSEFSALGPAGKGVLTISGGMAVYPFDGQTPAELVRAADEAQMFGAKKSGKNSIALVGEGGTRFAGE